MPKIYVDSMTLGGSNSMITPYSPKKEYLDSFSNKVIPSKFTDCENSIQQFGLFGGDIDYNTYYPEIKSSEEVAPKDEEFIEPMFRLLSEEIVSRNYCPTDFSRNGVLKASMSMLVGQTVNCDHETNIGNAIGSVKSVVWQDSFVQKGITVPAGINGVFKLDAKSNPRIARGIMMNPPSVHSNSVTVRFAWEKSHPDLSDEEFWNQFGKKGKDKKLVCRVVTEVKGYMETSLVSRGADPWAQLVNENGEINDPGYAKKYMSSFSDHTEPPEAYFFYSWKDHILDNEDTMENKLRDPVNVNTIDNKSKDNNNNSKDNNNNSNDMTLEEFIQSVNAGGYISLAEGQDMSAEAIISALKEIPGLKSNVSSLQEEKSNLESTIASLNQTLSNQKNMFDLGTSVLSEARNMAVESYKKLMGIESEEDSTLTPIKNVISLADYQGVKALAEGYNKQLEEKFPLHCQECGSKEVSRQVSAKPLEGKDTKSSYTMENLRNSKLK